MKALIIELNAYHTETFPIYSNLLPSYLGTDDIEFHYCYLPDKSLDLTSVYENAKPIISGFSYFLIRNLGLRVPVFTRKIGKRLQDLKADILIFNTVEPERNLAIFKAVEADQKIAILHNPERFGKEKKDNEHFFVLSDLLYEAYKDKVALDGYLLPYFKPYALAPLEAGSPKGRRLASEGSNGDHFLIGIQGWVNFKRRDYPFLIEIATILKEKSVDNVKFNIIGGNNKKGGRKLRDQIRDKGLSEYFILHESLNDKEFYTEIEKCDLLMPLLGKAQQAYFKKKITATLSHAAAYNKPMLLSAENADAWNLSPEICFTYNDAASYGALLTELNNIDQKKTAWAEWTNIKIENNKTLLKDSFSKGSSNVK